MISAHRRSKKSCVGPRMILELDNKGAVDIANNWSLAGRRKQIDTKQYFVRQLKEDGIIKVR